MKIEILSQIKTITVKLIEKGFSIDQQFPIEKNNEITWSGYKDISFALKDFEYGIIYKECLKERAYNFVLLDGAIIQMMYRVDQTNIKSHRLAFLPNPNSVRFQDEPETFEENYFGDKLFTEIKKENVVASPIRFDFDDDKDKYIELDHPYSHLTIGNYKNCRIPISAPISPFRFISFILRNFYFDKYVNSFSEKDFNCKLNFELTITKRECNLLHLNFN